MSNWKKHIIGGFISTTVLLVIMSFFIPLTLTFIGLSSVVSFIFSQLPDIDIQSSKIRWFLTVAGIGISFIQLVFYNNTQLAIIYLGIVLVIWLMVLIKGFGHRGWLHSILFGVLLSCFMFSYGYLYVIVAFINYLTHLVLDKKK